MAIGRTATGGMTLQDEAMGDTATQHNDGNGWHDDDKGKNGDGTMTATGGMTTRHDNGNARHDEGNG